MEKGLVYTSKVKVTQANTALALGSGDMEVFATRAIWKCLLRPPW